VSAAQAILDAYIPPVMSVRAKLASSIKQPNLPNPILTDIATFTN